MCLDPDWYRTLFGRSRRIANLDLCPPVDTGSAPVPDNATVKLIQDSINADPALKGASITVKVENNRLTLMGTVQSTAQSEQAMMDASKVQTNNNLPIGAYNMLTIQGR